MKALLIAFIILIPAAHASRYIVEAKHVLSIKEIKRTKLHIEKFAFSGQQAFAKHYVVSAKSEQVLLNLPWVKNVEPTFELQELSLLPSNNPTRIVSDELFPYQWGLQNEGQTFLREKDDIHNLPMVGTFGKDIAWTKLLPNISKSRVIVAVLDSGIDLTHPDLKENLWKNEKECGLDAKIDNDKNDVPGDCDGWNFTESIDSDAAKDVSDIDGHGTHVAGIIAAGQNNRGIVGVTPNALIMPVKVIKDAKSKSEVASSEAFARGILYATKNGAKVINMSLGWPRSLETKYLRDAVTFALEQGVVIVAAAGNNNNHEPLFPCAYDGVVCVAASNLNGKMAGFSNYGGHVDTIAPGEGILSTIPMIFSPDFFAIPGYDIKSGTSQATPFVAGLFASLRAMKPEIKIDEIFARVYQSQTSLDKRKYVLGGDLTWESLSQEISAPVIRPILKRVRQIVVKADQTETKIAILVRNFGLPSGEFQVKLESLSDGIEFSSEAQTVSDISSNKVKEIVFPVKILNVYAESDIKMKVTIIEGDKTHSYFNEIPVVRDVRTDPKLKTLKFTFVDKALPLGVVKEGDIVPFISTVDSYSKSTKHDFFMSRIIKVDKDLPKLEITIYNRHGQSYDEAPKKILIEHAIKMVNLIRVDVNFDGQEDYMVQALAGEKDKRYFIFSFYNHEMNPVWPKFQDVALKMDLYLESMNDISFIRHEHKSLGPMMVPAFVTNGQLPKADQVLTAFDRLDVQIKKRLYSLLPMDDGTFQVRALTTNVWSENIKRDLKSKWYETVEVEQLLPTSTKDGMKAQLRVLVSVGELSSRKLFIYAFDHKTNVTQKALPQLVLQSDDVDPLYKISSDGLKVEGDVYFNIYDRTRSKVVFTKDLEQKGQLIYRHDTETDLIAGHLVSFDQTDSILSILQTREELITITSQKSGIVKKSSRPKLRYSFLSQKLLSELYSPVISLRDGIQSPALYVDGTSVTGNRIHLLEVREGSLVSNIKNSILVPPTCKAMTPVPTESGSHDFMFLCFEQNSWMIKTFEMN